MIRRLKRWWYNLFHKDTKMVEATYPDNTVVNVVVQIADTRTRNGRVYTKDAMERAINDYNKRNQG